LGPELSDSASEVLFESKDGTELVGILFAFGAITTSAKDEGALPAGEAVGSVRIGLEASLRVPDVSELYLGLLSTLLLYISCRSLAFRRRWTAQEVDGGPPGGGHDKYSCLSLNGAEVPPGSGQPRLRVLSSFLRKVCQLFTTSSLTGWINTGCGSDRIAGSRV
jgi:hypothetical protein